ncbi:hypothetical protein ACIP86_30590, partial [Pseudomonas neuropathica]
TLVVAISHKHNRLPIPYRKGETVSCLSWGSFTAGAAGVACMLVVSGMLAAQIGDGGSQTGELLGEKLYEMNE